MARRRVLDTGFGINLVSALTGGVSERMKARQEEESKLRQILAAAFAAKQAERQFPSPEESAQQIALQSIAQQFPGYEDQWQMRPSATPDQQAEVRRHVEGQQQTQFQGRLEALQKYGLLKTPTPQMDATTLALLLRGDSTPTPMQSPLQTSPDAAPAPIQRGEGLESLPIVNRAAQAVRAGGRLIGAREAQSGFMESFSAQTAAAAKGFGDTANIAVEERKMIGESFDRDGETFERRQSRRARLANFFQEKEAKLQSILSQPVPQILKGVSRFGPRTETDPAIMQARRQAATDLSKLQQTRLLYEQMWKESDTIMPAIGQPRGSASARSFSSVEAAEAANLPPGTEVRINGRRAVIE